jgi:tetratricopeptide (TPR) repeat protein
VTQGLLSATLIVRDEEAVLDACLSSIGEVVDEIVIVDTGSVDASVDIAKSHGARVLHRPWDDDFSTPRNLALETATGQWILYIDADERLEGVDRASMDRLLRDADEVAFRILLRPQSTMTPYLEYRLWRSRPEIRFEGFIHERVVPSIHRVADAEGRPVSDCFSVLLDHVGYEGDQRRKHLRNLPLLTRFVAEQPDHLFARHHLARVLDGLGRREEAERELQATVDYIRTHRTWDPSGVLSYASLVELLQGGGREFRPLLEEARRRYPDNCVLLWTEGRDLSARGEYEAALLRFDAILEIAADGPAVGRPAYDRRLVGEVTHEARALCLFRLGRYLEAADAYGAAAECAPAELSYPARRAVALGRSAGAASG